MSGYSKNGRTIAGRVVVDWYKVLQISPSSTPNEIKTAYYKIAQAAHPDKHNGCSKKLEQFKRINEAYDILSNPTKRSEYDIKMGHYHHHQNAKSTYQRRTPVPKDYRKMHFSRPPPEWKMVWDHAKHYEMHYGDGFQKEAMKQALRTAEQDGTLIYRSSLGKGFTFAHLDDRTNKSSSSSTMNGSHLHGATTNSMNYNPYSKNPVQGPPKIIFDYQEVTHNFGGGGGSGRGSQNQKRQHITKHERIVYDLHLRRYERYRDEVRHESQHTTTQQTTCDTTKSTETASATSSSSTKKSPIYSRYDERYQTEQQQQQQQDPLISSIHLFSSFMGASTVVRNGDDNGDDHATTTNANSTTSRDDGATTTTPPNELTDHPVKNSSCIIM